MLLTGLCLGNVSSIAVIKQLKQHLMLMGLVLHELLRQYQSQASALLNHPEKSLNSINQQLLDAGFACQVNLALFRLSTHGGKVQLINGGMEASQWLSQCDVGPLGIKKITAYSLSYHCVLPFLMRL